MTASNTDTLDGFIILSEGLETWTIGDARAASYEPGCAAPAPTPDDPVDVAMRGDAAEIETNIRLQRAANKLWWWKHRQREAEHRRKEAEDEEWYRRQRSRWSGPEFDSSQPIIPLRDQPRDP